jgi:hypothetical protein
MTKFLLKGVEMLGIIKMIVELILSREESRLDTCEVY